MGPALPQLHFFLPMFMAKNGKFQGDKIPKIPGVNFLLKAAGLINPDGVAAKIKISKSEATVTPRSTYRVKHVGEGNSGTVTW